MAMQKLLVLFSGILLLAAVVQAEPITTAADSTEVAANRPARGMTMVRVESAYGQPRGKHTAVGEPPITRWEYDGFVVYFEYQHVIHAVEKRNAT